MTDFAQYTFKILDLSPATVPMARLMRYGSELAKLLGSPDKVHLGGVESGSVIFKINADVDAKPVISPRLRNLRTGESPTEALKAMEALNRMLWEDGTSADLGLPGGELIRFSGRSASEIEIGAIRQATTIQGRLIRLEGSKDKVSIGIEDQGGLAGGRITAPAALAQEMSSHFQRLIRVSGSGRWRRDDAGRWCLEALDISTFDPLTDEPLQDVLARARAFLDNGEASEAIAALEDLRR